MLSKKDEKASDNILKYHDCDRHDIFKNIPLHNVFPLVAKYVNTHPKKRSIDTIINSPHWAQIVGGVVKSIKNQHLFGFLAGVGEHFADVLDHYVDVTKSVIDPPSADGNFLEKLNLKEKESKKSEIVVPFENAGGLIRSVVAYLPAEESKHCYVKKYEPIAKKMKEQVSSKEFKKIVGLVHKANQKMNPPPKKVEEPAKNKKKDKDSEKIKTLKNPLEKFKISKPFDFLKQIKKE